MVLVLWPAGGCAGLSDRASARGSGRVASGKYRDVDGDLLALLDDQEVDVGDGALQRVLLHGL
ncbi:hypothetical protein, partial [Streptomyces goshikiensis]|uniref:hypothetical protein n=1 Tax=Streptomyces goshikiensis TaxID=1942 RepID=UPI003D9DB547